VGKVAHSRRRKRRKQQDAVCRAPKGRRRTPPRCRPKRRRRSPGPSSPPITVPPPIPQSPGVTSPISVYSGPWGPAQAERLLWRAGFGPAAGWTERFHTAGLKGAVEALTRPQGAPVLTGPAPVIGDPPEPIQPYDAYGHDHQWFLDRMVRSNQPLVERMTLIWHDWFATSYDKVGSQRQMLDQNATFRSNALGSFRDMLRAVTRDPAMLMWLDGVDNKKGAINENYGREVMELFTLGADRGAYTESDVRQLAKAFSGWTADISNERGSNFRFDPARFDSSVKTLFAGVPGYGPKVGNFDWEGAVQLCIEHPLHPSFAVGKLWSYFIPTPPPAGERKILEQHYVKSGYQIRPVVEAILLHPDLYTGPRMVKPPVVFCAGMLRALGRSVDREWWWLTLHAGQLLFHPPDVSGWDDSRWLDTQRVLARWEMIRTALQPLIARDDAASPYDGAETPAQAVSKALAFWGNPSITPELSASLHDFAASCLPAVMTSSQKRQFRSYRQNALRQLIASSPDYQTS
jgi:hypothetical protein